MEEKKEVRVFNVDFKCPKCDTGYLRPTGRVYATYPPKYPHKCNNNQCQYTETFKISYPTISYDPIDDNIDK